jgi:hypothetical protein
MSSSPPASAVVPATNGRLAPLPGVQGRKTAVAVRERLARVMGELHDGARERLSAEQARRLAADMLFAYWAATHEHPKALLDTKRERVVMQALAENGDEASELFYAIDGCKRSPHHMGKNDTNTKYDDITLILRDRKHIEDFARRCPGYSKGTEHPMVAKYREALLGEREEFG